MKNNVLTAVLLLLCTVVFAQAPQLLNYQAVVRNASGQPVTSGNVKLRFTIHDGTSTGPTVFAEVQTVVPNQFGLVTASVGAVNNNLATVNWGGGAKHLQVEVDITGGNNFTDMGTTQLLSVPYALYAEKAGTADNVDDADANVRASDLTDVEDTGIMTEGEDVGIMAEEDDAGRSASEATQDKTMVNLSGNN